MVAEIIEQIVQQTFTEFCEVGDRAFSSGKGILPHLKSFTVVKSFRIG